MADKKEPPKSKSKGGRPSSYRDEYVEQVKHLAMLGATDKQVADALGVRESTINAWKLAHPEFAESLKAGKLTADARVAQALYHRATGYSHPAVKIMVVGGEVQHVPYIERYPPDTTAAIFWLKNRQPSQWRDKPNAAEHDGDTAPESVTVEVVNARTRDS